MTPYSRLWLDIFWQLDWLAVTNWQLSLCDSYVKSEGFIEHSELEIGFEEVLVTEKMVFNLIEIYDLYE